MTSLKYTIASLWLVAAAAHAENQCHFYLVNQSDSSSGFLLALEGSIDSTGKCALGSVNLRLNLGDSSALHHVDASFAWQTGVVYTAKAVITAAGPQQLSINGQPAGSVQGAFKPAQGTLAASQIADSGTATGAYLVTQISLRTVR